MNLVNIARTEISPLLSQPCGMFQGCGRMVDQKEWDEIKSYNSEGVDWQTPMEERAQRIVDAIDHSPAVIKRAQRILYGQSQMNILIQGWSESK